MFRKFWQAYLLVAIILFVIDWFIGVAESAWSAFRHIFAIINFPFSFAFLWLESKGNVWWHDVFGYRFEVLSNNEIGGMLAFVIMVLLQAMLITAMILVFRQRLTKMPGLNLGEQICKREGLGRG